MRRLLFHSAGPTASFPRSWRSEARRFRPSTSQLRLEAQRERRRSKLRAEDSPRTPEWANANARSANAELPSAGESAMDSFHPKERPRLAIATPETQIAAHNGMKSKNAPDLLRPSEVLRDGNSDGHVRVMILNARSAGKRFQADRASLRASGGASAHSLAPSLQTSGDDEPTRRFT